MRKSAFFILTFMSAILFSQKKWTLQECVNYAVENNLQVIETQFNQKIQDYNLSIAKRQYLPSVSGNVNNTASFGQGRDTFGRTGSNDNFSNSANVGADMLLFNHGKIEKNIRLNQFKVEAFQYDVERVKNDISLQIAQQYLSVLLNREVTTISKSALENAEKLYQRAKITTQVGTTAQTILAEAESALAREKLNVKTAEINTDRSLFSLAMLLQLPDYKNFDIQNVSVQDDIEAPLYTAAQILDKAFENQPQIKAAESRIKSAEAQTEITETAFWPTISANAGLGTSYFYLFNAGTDLTGSKINQSGFFKQYKDNFGQQVGVSASIPIFNKGITRLNVEQSKISEEIAKNALLLQKQEVLQNVQKAQFDAESNYESFVASREAEKSAKLALDFTEKSYNAGRATIYDLNSARNNYANAQGSVAQAKYNYLFSLKLLNFYAGIPLTL
ncbi:TolC family protein [Kaistella polysaccharea]|uniref:TolC family protein n=1 Tax=Kaistella polysaccharea TaxID=2878534 RepID=UPI001CF2A6F7|nr:TolC family protein [Kaistella polysaccharea]